MTYTTQTLVANVQYSGTDAFVSNAVPAANYYGGHGAVQTITFQTNGFVGTITVQATLTDSPESVSWVNLAEYGNASHATTGTSSTSVIGNFTWLRAQITEFTAGNIVAVTTAY